MGIRPRKWRNQAPQAAGSDANEAFIRSRCLEYMIRIMDRYPLWDHETIEFLFWLLESQADLLTALIGSSIPKDRHAKFTSSLSDATSASERALVLSRQLGQWPKHSLRTLVKPLITIMESSLRDQETGHSSNQAANLSEFTNLFGLTDQEAEICLFLAMMSSWAPVEQYFDTHLDCDRYTGRKYMLTALGLTAGQFEGMIHGRLHRLGFVDQDRSWLELSKDCLPLINESAHAVLTREHYRPFPAPTVALDSHVVQCSDLEHLRSLLDRKPDSSTHVLFYGPPGTGKTSFAQALAASIGCPAYEVLHHTENKTLSRRVGLTACLNMTNHGEGSLVIVDEADSVLNDDGWLMRGESQDKGWLNGLLEEPGARVIWITNRVENIDPSVRRRFAYSLHFPTFGRRQREQLWESILRKHRVKRFFTEADIGRLALDFEVSAGAIDLAVGKARETGFGGKGDLLATVHRSLDAHLTLLRDGRPSRDKDSHEQQYVLEALNLDCEPAALLEHVKRFDTWWRLPIAQRPVRNLNLLLHGPSGTGKTELARHLAHELDRPLVVKRTSDLLGAYIGQTEQALAEAFAQAEADEAILLIDEADSLLFPRSRAQRSWEVSFTNEFLTQMERFRGMLVCTTNRVADLDDASLRRFGRKVEFGYLNSRGILALYNNLLAPLANRQLPPGQRETLQGLPHLTPGMFKIIRDEALFQARALDHSDLISGLCRESRFVAERQVKRVGFSC
ncbi:MAG: ATP-binding protein [Gemmatimonadales bacterium]|nr:ATP-binding protein [Gemmatimonadales bacterium]